ncbi:MAG: ABC transporter permease [Reichenbachiella sp.]|uniref:ABC transporter permease n=1 Tax=Reichenbachiella sp. TaxID=2184521 RepID=UPI00326616AC
MINPQPPNWIERFLNWYCAPELLDEIQGDAHELYTERLEEHGKLKADIRYIYDIIRFCRLSNMKRSSNIRKPDSWDILVHSTLKIATRNVRRNKLLFSVKMLSLSLCLAFSLLLAVFVLQEYSYDQHIADHQSIYRIGTKTTTLGAIDEFANAPGLLSEALEEIPEIQYATRVTLWGDLMHVFTVDEISYTQEVGMIVQEEFARMFNLQFIQGNSESLNEPDNIVLTESTAKKFFGDENPVGKIITLNNGFWLDVAGVIEDPLPTSHLKFDLLVSRNSFDVQPTWDELDGYTYCKIRPGVSAEVVESKIIQVYDDHLLEITKHLDINENDSFAPIFQNITSIHLNNGLKNDSAVTRDVVNLHFLVILSVVFFFSGFINFLNLTIADITSHLKQTSVLQIMGGSSSGIAQSILANTLLGIVVLIPLTSLLFILGINATETFLGITIAPSSLISMPFLLLLGMFLSAYLLSSKICSLLISKSFNLLVALKGKLGTQFSRMGVRESLLTLQLSFSIMIIGLILIMVDQFDFISKADNGYEDKQTLVIRTPVTSFVSGISTFEESLRKLNGVQKVSMSSLDMDSESDDRYFSEIETNDGMKNGYFNHHSWGFEFLDLLKIELVEGRSFDRSRGTDQSGKVFLINESAIEVYGWKDPIGKKVYVEEDKLSYGHVIGVVKDFRTTSMYKEIEPLIVGLTNDKSWNEHVYVKLDAIHSSNLIAEIEEIYFKHFEDVPLSWEYLDSKLANLYYQDTQLRDIFKIGLLISLMVSCLGIFSISALMLILKAKEMSIRKVVGARSYDLFYLHISNFIKFTLLAAICSSPIIYYLSNYWLNNFAYRIDLNVWYFIVPCLITLFIILVTSGVHGLRSSKIDLLKTLKEG